MRFRFVSNSKAVVEFRQRRKVWAVASFGGKCGVCGYDKCPDALEFHHLDPTEKDFTPSGKSCSRQVFVEELRKCVMLCSNCHREHHAGVLDLPEDITRFDESYAEKPLPEKEKHPCAACGKQTIIAQKFCSVKCSSGARYGTAYPPREEVVALVEEHGYKGTGRLLGVSDNAVRKFLKRTKHPKQQTL